MDAIVERAADRDVNYRWLDLKQRTPWLEGPVRSFEPHEFVHAKLIGVVTGGLFPGDDARDVRARDRGARWY